MERRGAEDLQGRREDDAQTAAEIDHLRQRWPGEWRDGARCAFLRRFDGARAAGGYPVGFHRWTLDRRNAWLSGFNRGFHDRLRRTQEIAK